MNDSVAPRVFFGVLLIAVSAVFIWLIRSFLQPIFWAVALGIVFFPLHAWIDRQFGKRPSLAAGTSVVAVLLIVVLPLIAVITAMAGEAAAMYDRLACETSEPNEAGEAAVTNCEPLDLGAALDWAQAQIPSQLVDFVPDLAQVETQLSSMAVGASQFLASQAISIGQNTIRITVYFFLMLYLLFFFLRDGTKILDGLVRVLPFGNARERHLLERFAAVSRATIKGTLVVGIVQGFIGGVLFAAVGFHAPVLWGVVMALLSIVPAVGPALVWIPGAIILFVQGQIWHGIAVILVGSLVIGLVDNLLRPILVGRDTRMPDYLILLSTLGGLLAFGLAGVVIGPIIAAFFLSVWDMAEDEYTDADDTDTPTPPDAT